MKTELTSEEFSDYNPTPVNYDYWRHGQRIQYHVNIGGYDYLTSYISVSTNEGMMEEDFPVDLFPARKVMRPDWEIIK